MIFEQTFRIKAISKKICVLYLLINGLFNELFITSDSNNLIIFSIESPIKFPKVQSAF